MKSSIKSLDHYLNQGSISFCGVSRLPDFVYSKDFGTVQVFTRSREESVVIEENYIQKFVLGDLLELREKQIDVLFLDTYGLKILFAKFPVTSKYILVPFTPRSSWVIAIPGLLRRLSRGLLKVEGVRTFTEDGDKRRWVVLRHMLSKSLQVRHSISEEVGVQGFIDHLNQENIDYVVIRFFEKLPELNREGGDLDILVSDEDESKVRDFLQSNPGKTGIDVWTPSRTTHNSVTYFPPPIARKILDSAVSGPAGARVPSPTNTFFAFAYHCLYHKGHLSGVPTSIKELSLNKKPENDYTAHLKRYAEEACIDVDITMESLDEYLSKCGWQPKSDTLLKLAPWNKWVDKRFFSKEASSEIGLNVFILKKKAVKSGIANEVVHRISNHGDIRIIYQKYFSEREVYHVKDSLRGGVWDDKSGAFDDYIPAVAIVVLDTKIAKKSLAGSVLSSLAQRRIKKLKKDIRRSFDSGKYSIVHATDFTHEAWEYIEECFTKDEIREIKKEVSVICEGLKLSIFEKLFYKTSSLPHRISTLYRKSKSQITGSMVHFLMD